MEEKLITAAEAEILSESGIDSTLEQFIKYFNANIKRTTEEGSRSLLVTTSPEFQYFAEEELTEAGYAVSVRSSTTMMVEW